MEVNVMKNILDNIAPQRDEFNRDYEVSQRYYLNKNDISGWNGYKSSVSSGGSANLDDNLPAYFDNKDKDGNRVSNSNPLRKADNRVPSNFHQLLVDQEAGYLATNPPQIDVQDDDLNKQISADLGDEFASRLNQLVVDAANSGVAWIHYWYDSQDNSFQYGIVPPDQVTPIYSSDLNRKLSAIVREYEDLDENDGNLYHIVEYWDDKQCTAFRARNADYSDLTFYDEFYNVDISTGDNDGQTSTFEHNFGRIPFIEFDKNKYQTPELNKYKGHIDIYDKVYNNFVNDLDDFQQSVIVLKGYGGEKMDEFLQALKNDKAINVDSDGGVDQLQVEIPTQARDDVLQIARDNIFIDGQGIDPKDFNAKSATSGAAIKMFYSHLELKASTTQQYFSLAVAELVRAILRHVNYPKANTIDINQTWNRAQINNTLEQAQTIAQVAQFSSKEAIAKNNPLVPDWQGELQAQKDEQVDDPYSNNNQGGK